MRESRNPTRALTGFLLGYAVGFVMSSLNLIYVVLVLVLYSGYTLIFGALAPRIIRWRQRRGSPEDFPPPLPISSKPDPTIQQGRDEE